MSGEAPHSAKQARAAASAWLARREFGNWSPEDQAAFEAWAAASPSHMVAYLRVEQVWQRAERLRALSRPMRAAKPQAPAAASILPKMVAVLFLFATIGMGVWFTAPTEQAYETPIGVRKTITFADGSKVELNTDTVLRARVTSGSRHAELVKGEAFFDIQHDAARPFTVLAGAWRVTDLGTKFIVRRETGRVEVTLVEGSAEVEPVAKGVPGKRTVLVPGDIVVATADGLKVTKKSTPALANQMAWRRGLLIFNHATLADVAAQFNRYNNQKLIITAPSVARRTIGGTFPTSGVEEFAEVAKGIFGFRIKTHGNEITIEP